MAAREAIEREFGVPFPGEILAQERWSRTALRRLPRQGPLPWKTIFGREAPIILDLGCGNGRFVIGSAIARAGHDHLGLDALPLVIRYATKRANQRGLTNVRFAVGNAEDFLENLVAPQTISEIHVYHPQPFHEPGKEVLRLLQPRFLALVHRSLLPKGMFVIQTDSRAYWRYIQRVIPKLFEFHEQPGGWPDAPLGRTRREIIARGQRLKIFRGWAVPRNIEAEAVGSIVGEMPEPVFESERKK